MFVAEKKLPLKLEVVAVEGWKRSQWQDQTGLEWVNPSPNMRSLAAATLYPGVGLLEFTNVSVGRGTATPFEILGAPWIKAKSLAAALTAEKLRGVGFQEVEFTPESSVFAGKKCYGVKMIVFDRESFQPVNLGLALARTLHKNHAGTFDIDKFNQLLFHPTTFKGVEKGLPISDIRKLWQPSLDAFIQRRRTFLLYH